MTSPRLVLIYDHDCPACRYYVSILQIKKNLTEVELVSARSAHPLVAEATGKGLDLNEGFVLVVGDVFYHADAAIHQLALLGSNNTYFSRFNYWVFSSPGRARFVYPILSSARHLLLKVMGIKGI